MKINISLVMKNLNGEALKDEKKKNFTLKQALANIVLDSRAGGKMKMYDLADRIHKAKGDSIDVDSSDLGIIVSAVETTELYNNLINGQIIKYLKKLDK